MHMCQSQAFVKSNLFLFSTYLTWIIVLSSPKCYLLHENFEIPFLIQMVEYSRVCHASTAP